MMRRFSLIVSGLALLAGLLLPVASASAAWNPFQQACTSGAAKSSPACTTNGTDPITGGNGILYKVDTILSIITGVAAVIVVIIAGFMYVTAGDDSSKAGNARKAILGAVIGLVVVALSRVVIVFLLNTIH